MKLFFDAFSTPCGDFSVAVNAAGAVVATAFGPRAALLGRLRLCQLIVDTPSGLPPENPPGVPGTCQLLIDTRSGRARVKSPGLAGACQLIDDTGRTRDVREQVLGYFAGERRAFDAPLAPRGTEFQRRVWDALQAIPFGETRSYGRLAAQLGSPAASRAVGRANATNPICLIVPCHRVIGADGSLTGFAFGEEIKRWLLEHERSFTQHARVA